MKRRFCFVIDGKFLMDTTSAKDATIIYEQIEHMGNGHTETKIHKNRTVYYFSASQPVKKYKII